MARVNLRNLDLLDLLLAATMAWEVLAPRLIASLVDIRYLLPASFRLIAHIGIRVPILIRVVPGRPAPTRSSLVGLLDIHDQFLLLRGWVLRQRDLLLSHHIHLTLVDGRLIPLFLLLHLLRLGRYL